MRSEEAHTLDDFMAVVPDYLCALIPPSGLPLPKTNGGTTSCSAEHSTSGTPPNSGRSRSRRNSSAPRHRNSVGGSSRGRISSPRERSPSPLEDATVTAEIMDLFAPVYAGRSSASSAAALVAAASPRYSLASQRSNLSGVGASPFVRTGSASGGLGQGEMAGSFGDSSGGGDGFEEGNFSPEWRRLGPGGRILTSAITGSSGLLSNIDTVDAVQSIIQREMSARMHRDRLFLKMVHECQAAADITETMQELGKNVARQLLSLCQPADPIQENNKDNDDDDDGFEVRGFKGDEEISCHSYCHKLAAVAPATFLTIRQNAEISNNNNNSAAAASSDDEINVAYSSGDSATPVTTVTAAATTTPPPSGGPQSFNEKPMPFSTSERKGKEEHTSNSRSASVERQVSDTNSVSAAAARPPPVPIGALRNQRSASGHTIALSNVSLTPVTPSLQGGGKVVTATAAEKRNSKQTPSISPSLFGAAEVTPSLSSPSVINTRFNEPWEKTNVQRYLEHAVAPQRKTFRDRRLPQHLQATPYQAGLYFVTCARCHHVVGQHRYFSNKVNEDLEVLRKHCHVAMTDCVDSVCVSLTRNSICKEREEEGDYEEERTGDEEDPETSLGSAATTPQSANGPTSAFYSRRQHHPRVRRNHSFSHHSAANPYTTNTSSAEGSTDRGRPAALLSSQGGGLSTHTSARVSNTSPAVRGSGEGGYTSSSGDLPGVGSAHRTTSPLGTASARRRATTTSTSRDVTSIDDLLAQVEASTEREERAEQNEMSRSDLPQEEIKGKKEQDIPLTEGHENDANSDGGVAAAVPLVHVRKTLSLEFPPGGRSPYEEEGAALPHSSRNSDSTSPPIVDPPSLQASPAAAQSQQQQKIPSQHRRRSHGRSAAAGGLLVPSPSTSTYTSLRRKNAARAHSVPPALPTSSNSYRGAVVTASPAPLSSGKSTTATTGQQQSNNSTAASASMMNIEQQQQQKQRQGGRRLFSGEEEEEENDDDERVRTGPPTAALPSQQQQQQQPQRAASIAAILASNRSNSFSAFGEYGGVDASPRVLSSPFHRQQSLHNTTTTTSASSLFSSSPGIGSPQRSPRFFARGHQPSQTQLQQQQRVPVGSARTAAASMSRADMLQAAWNARGGSGPGSGSSGGRLSSPRENERTSSEPEEIATDASPFLLVPPRSSHNENRGRLNQVHVVELGPLLQEYPYNVREGVLTTDAVLCSHCGLYIGVSFPDLQKNVSQQLTSVQEGNWKHCIQLSVSRDFTLPHNLPSQYAFLGCGYVHLTPTTMLGCMPIPGYPTSFFGNGLSAATPMTLNNNATSIMTLLPQTVDLSVGAKLCCASCSTFFCDANAVLCTNRSWHIMQRRGNSVVPSSERACFVNHISESSIVKSAPYALTLSQGRFLMTDVSCAKCRAVVGYHFEKDLTPSRININHVGRYGLVMCCLRVSYIN